VDLIRQEVQERGVVDDMTYGMNFYLLILGCLSATGAASYGAIKWWQFMRSTCTVAFRPAEATRQDVELMNSALENNPSAGAAFDAEVERKRNSSKVPKRIRDAAQNIQKARSRESSPAGSSRSSGSGGVGPSQSAWVRWGHEYMYRDAGGKREWRRKDSKGEWVASKGPRK
jgi:hypothetical protein